MNPPGTTARLANLQFIALLAGIAGAALSVYGAVWLVAMARSFALRPILVIGNELEIRAGLLATLRVPLARIARATPISEAAAGDWKMLPLSAPNLRLSFTMPVEARTIYGRRRTVRHVVLPVDDPGAFVDALGCAHAER